MSITKIIKTIVEEVGYRTKEGAPDFKKPEHLSILSEVLDEYDLGSIKYELIRNLTEAGEGFKNPVLDKEVKYRDKNGDEKKNKVGNLLRLPADDPGKIEAERHLPKDDAERQKVMNDLGIQNQPGRTGPATTDSNIKDDQEGGEEEEKQMGTALKSADYTDSLPDGDPAKPKKKKSEQESETVIGKVPENKEELKSVDAEQVSSALKMTQKQAKIQAKETGKKNVGAGTAASRAGEAMVHTGLRELINGRSPEEIRNNFTELVNTKDHVLNSKLGKKWVDSTMNSLDRLDMTIGIDNISDVVWDTEEGKKALGINPKIDTTSDMFIRTKDGKNIGISLKKDGSVFLANGGWASESERILNSMKDDLSEGVYEHIQKEMSIESFKKDLSDRLKNSTSTISVDDLQKSYEKLKSEIDSGNVPRDFRGSKQSRYLEILEDPELLFKKIKLGTNLALETKAYTKLLKLYHKDEYNDIREADNELTKRAFTALDNFPEAKLAMNRQIMKKMHIKEALGLSKKLNEDGVDGFKTIYGVDNGGADLSAETLSTLLGSEFMDKLNSIRDGDGDYSDLEKTISDSMVIDYDSGNILFKHESNKLFPLFKLTGRSRSIGDSPVMEMVQTPFMAHALKVGSFDYDSWSDKAKKRFKKAVVEDDAESPQ